MDALIQARHLRKTFGTLPAVDGVSLQVHAGEIYGLVGPDGAGKTTIMRLLCGALHPDYHGDPPVEMQVAGFDVLRQTEQARSQIGYLSQRFSLYHDLTVLENIRFFAEVRGLKPNEWLPRCMQILEFVGLDSFKGRLAGQLSGGMKQKLGLAAALVARPRVLLLDEPTTGVDPVTRQDFWQLIIGLVAPSSEAGMCVLISTPYMDEATRCQRIGFIRQGKMISEGSPGELRASLNERIVELRGAPLMLLRQIAAQDPNVEDVRTFGDRLHLRLRQPGAQATIERLQIAVPQGGADFIEARAVPPVLEDVFIDLSAREN